jgi:hypothetical protein
MTEETEISLENLPKPWTRKQYMFAMGIIGGLSQQEAAKQAGYSHKTAHVQSTHMLKKLKFKHVQDFINKHQNKVAKKYAYDHEKHVEEISRQAHFNILDFYQPDPETGELKIDWRKVPYEMGTLIDAIDTKQLSIKTVEGGEEISLPVLSTFVKFSDRAKARDMLNKMMGNYEKDNRRTLTIEGGDKPLEFKSMSMEEAAKAYQESLKDI